MFQTVGAVGVRVRVKATGVDLPTQANFLRGVAIKMLCSSEVGFFTRLQGIFPTVKFFSP